MKKREGEKEGKVEKTGRKKTEGENGQGDLSSTQVLLLYTLDTLYVSYFSTDTIRYHGQSNV